MADSILPILLDLKPQVLDTLLPILEHLEAIYVILLGGAVQVDTICHLFGCLGCYSLAVHLYLLHCVAEACVLYALKLAVYLVASEPAMVVFLRGHGS